MNVQLKEINEILALCDAMIADIQNNGIIHMGNSNYEEYKAKIQSFLYSHNLMRVDYAIYTVLDALYFSPNERTVRLPVRNINSYTINMSEAQAIRNAVITMKHEQFPDSFERIFISHREKDEVQITAFIELLHAIGIPRPTVGNEEKAIFCTSHPATYIENGVKNLEEIKAQFNCPTHTFFILWYTDNYFESQACLNEAGAIWASNKKYQEILMPGFESSKIGGLLDKQPVWFRANDKFRLNTFKEQLESMFNLDPLTQNAWEKVRDIYISKINSLTGGTDHANS